MSAYTKDLGMRNMYSTRAENMGLEKIERNPAVREALMCFEYR